MWQNTKMNNVGIKTFIHPFDFQILFIKILDDFSIFKKAIIFSLGSEDGGIVPQLE